jgi:hypothetical protein
MTHCISGDPRFPPIANVSYMQAHARTRTHTHAQAHARTHVSYTCRRSRCGMTAKLRRRASLRRTVREGVEYTRKAERGAAVTNGPWPPSTLRRVRVYVCAGGDAGDYADLPVSCDGTEGPTGSLGCLSAVGYLDSVCWQLAGSRRRPARGVCAKATDMPARASAEHAGSGLPATGSDGGCSVLGPR